MGQDPTDEKSSAVTIGQVRIMPLRCVHDRLQLQGGESIQSNLLVGDRQSVGDVGQFHGCERRCFDDPDPDDDRPNELMGDHGKTLSVASIAGATFQWHVV